MHRRSIWFAGLVARMGEEHQPRRVMFGEMVRANGYSFGQKKDWMERLEEDLREFGIKSERWR